LIFKNIFLENIDNYHYKETFSLKNLKLKQLSGQIEPYFKTRVMINVEKDHQFNTT